jgi:hypothetical protein
MSDVSHDQVFHLAKQLGDADRRRLIGDLQRTLPPGESPALTLDMILEEHRRRVEAGAFENLTSLRNRWADPAFAVSEEELRRGFKEISNQWWEDFDGLFDEE